MSPAVCGFFIRLLIFSFDCAAVSGWTKSDKGRHYFEVRFSVGGECYISRSFLHAQLACCSGDWRLSL